MSDLRTVHDIKQFALERAGELKDGTSEFDADAITLINNWQKQVLSGSNTLQVDCGDPWPWGRAQNPGVLTLQPYFESTATMTKGSNSGLFQFAPLYSVEGWHFKIEGYAELYRITSHVAGELAFTIDGDEGFIEEDVTAGACRCYKLEYELTNILRLVSPMRCFRRQAFFAANRGEIEIIDLASMDRDYPLYQLAAGNPDKMAITWQDNQDGRIKLRINRVPAEKIRIEYEYFPLPVALRDTITGAIDSVSDNGTGSARIHTTQPHGLVTGDEVVITLGSYSGTYKVTIFDTQNFDIRAPFGITEIGSFVSDTYPLVPEEHRAMLAYCTAYSILLDKEDTKLNEMRGLAINSVTALAAAYRRIKGQMQHNLGRLIPRRDQGMGNRERGW